MTNTLTLSGWTQPKDALLPLVPQALTFDYSDYADEASAFLALAKAAHEVEQVVAWSMGAQLALKAVALGVITPKRMLLLAPPLQFVSTPDFKLGMDPLTFQQFRDNYAKNPARTKERFHALVAKGDENTHHVLRALTHHAEVEDTQRWLPWLDHLGKQSLRGLKMPYNPTITVVHGDQDAIIPVAQASHWPAYLPKVTVHIWQGVAHAPHLHDAERLKDILHMQGEHGEH